MNATATSVILESVRSHAERSPDKPALICAKHTLTYAQLWRCANAVAAWLVATKGISRGDRIVMSANAKDPWFAAMYLGSHLAGAVAVPLDERLGESACLAVHERVLPAHRLAGDDLRAVRAVIEQAALGGDYPTRIADPVRLDDAADIMFTSGSTGAPKGVVLTHGNIGASATNINAFIGNSASDREVVNLPLSHSFGLGRLRCNLLAGGTIILVPGLTFPALTFEALERHEATGLASVPAGFALMLRAGGEKLAQLGERLSYVEIGSAAMDHRLKQELMRRLPRTRICMHYGLTEASRSAFLEFHRDAEHLETVGKPAPNVTIRVTDADGRPLAAGQSGRIRIRAGTVMKEYWRDPSRTQAVLDTEGWLDTGDVGHFDSHGYLVFEGRGDDMINVGGLKVYPREVEMVAESLEAVAECACVGSPDPDGMLGHVPVLYVVLRAGHHVDAKAIIDVARGRMVAHAVPRAVRFVSELPKTDSGKVLRVVLRSRESDLSAAGN